MIKVLSYNIYDSAMKGDLPPTLCKPVGVALKVSYNTCLQNIVKFIDTNSPCDFVGLQEAVHWDVIKHLSTGLNNFASVYYKTNARDVYIAGKAAQSIGLNDEIVTFYDPAKYTLDTNDNIIKGILNNNYRRPFLILFFNDNLCVINLHADQTIGIKNFDNDLMNSTDYNKNMDAFNTKFATYDIIMMGDFNDPVSINDSVSIFTDAKLKIQGGRTLYGVTKTKTCCDSRLTQDNCSHICDHILSTYDYGKPTVYRVPGASDHKPIIANIDTKKKGKLNNQN